MGYKIIKLKDIYNSIGEAKTKEILKEYKCELNKDVEYFIREKAIEFAKQGIAETFIVMSQFKGKDVIVGYFAITNKAINIKGIILSKTKKKRLIKFAQYDNVFKTYSIALPLIGQIGKNYNKGYNRLISGDLLLKLACDKIKLAQNILGGRFAFLECEDKPQLKEFYEKMDLFVLEKEILKKMKEKIMKGNIYFKCYVI